jgi:hypothetical protein
MSNALKAALLSGLVLPGLGHFVLKHRARGIALMLGVLAGLLAVTTKASQSMLPVVEKLVSEGGPVDVNTVLNEVTRAFISSGDAAINLSLLLIVLCWAIGVVDSYRLGKKKGAEAKE